MSSIYAFIFQYLSPLPVIGTGVLGAPLDSSTAHALQETAPGGGAKPGSISVAKVAVPPRVRIISHDGGKLVDTLLDTDAPLPPQIAQHKDLIWIDIQGLGDTQLIQHVGKLFNLHPLALADVVNVPQRPKVDMYEDHGLAVLRMLELTADGDLDVDQISVSFGQDFVFTAQEKPGDVLDPIRKRLLSGGERFRDPDYLAYAIIDAIVDSYYPLVEALSEHLENVEGEIFDNADQSIVSEIQTAKQALAVFRRSVWPLREALSALVREESRLISKDTRLYLRDTYDHASQIAELVDSFRDITGGLMNTYMSVVSHRMNEVMHLLTVLSTIFIPLTFITGLYGMNFANMPELRHPLGYFVALGVMAIVTISLLLYFRSRGWLGASGRPKRS